MPYEFLVSALVTLLVVLDPAGKVLRESTGYDGDTAANLIAWIDGKKSN